MVFNIQVETASLAFATLSLFVTSMSSLASIAMIVVINILMANFISGKETKNFVFEVAITEYGMPITALAVFLSVMALTFAFSVILTKGLISKKAHLVKAYYVYGVTMTSFFVIPLLSYLIIIGSPFNAWGFAILFGGFLYTPILMMIRKTYLKLATTDHDQFCHKKLEENSIA